MLKTTARNLIYNNIYFQTNSDLSMNQQMARMSQQQQQQQQQLQLQQGMERSELLHQQQQQQQQHMSINQVQQNFANNQYQVIKT
jgi:hypothetical protein